MCQLAATVTAPDAIIGSKLPLSEYEIPASMMPSGSTSAAGAAVSGVEVAEAPQPARTIAAIAVPATAAASRPARWREGVRCM